jgi:hypothetical protein
MRLRRQHSVMKTLTTIWIYIGLLGALTWALFERWEFVSVFSFVTALGFLCSWQGRITNERLSGIEHQYARLHVWEETLRAEARMFTEAALNLKTADDTTHELPKVREATVSGLQVFDGDSWKPLVAGEPVASTHEFPRPTVGHESLRLMNEHLRPRDSRRHRRSVFDD